MAEADRKNSHHWISKSFLSPSSFASGWL